MSANTLPRHVAFIMDGNGRWAEERGLPRVLGHQAGAETVRRVTAYARARGVPYLTLYAFSTENWSRPRGEVDALMELLGMYVDSETPALNDKGVRLNVIGDMAGLPETLRGKLAAAMTATAGNRDLTLTLAINYGGRDEIVRAARKAAAALAAGGLSASALNEETFAAHLDCAGMPDPDLIVRTAGEMRLSNFLIWEGAYAELLFTPRRWPDFSDADFEEALAAYAERNRKFGGASA